MVKFGASNVPNLTIFQTYLDGFMQQCYTKFDCILAYKRVHSLPNGINFVLP